MREAVLYLRTNRLLAENYLSERGEEITLDIFVGQDCIFDESPGFQTRDKAREVLTALRLSAQETKFKLEECKLDAEDQNKINEYPLTSTDQQWSKRIWLLQKSGTVKVPLAEAKRFVIPPSFSLVTGVGQGPCDPLFNVLQPCLSTDLPFFKGRDKEVEEFHQLTKAQRLVLLFGKKRIGKSSLLLCGLANKLEAGPGEMLSVRYRGQDMMADLDNKLRSELKRFKIRAKKEDSLRSLLEKWFDYTDQDMFLVFDELDGLFVKTTPEWERAGFFNALQGLYSADLPHLRIILSVREEFLGAMSDYDTIVPDLLTHRYHIHPLTQAAMFNVTFDILSAFTREGKMEVEEPVEVAKLLGDAVVDEDGNVPFHCVETYLNQVHQQACARSGGKTPLINAGLLGELGSAQSLVGDAIQEQDDALVKQIEDLPEGQAGHLELMREDLAEAAQDCGCTTNNVTVIPAAAASAAVVPVPTDNPTYTRMRWMLLAAIGALLLSSYAFCLLGNPAAGTEDACLLAEEADDCHAFLNYLCTEGGEADCSDQFRDKLDERDCEVWQDYQAMLRMANCEAYQTFYRKYTGQSLCVESVLQRITALGCPLPTDTVERVIEVRDTIVRRVAVPTISGRIPNAIDVGFGCELIDEIVFKQVGPLLFTTQPLAGSPYRWEDALQSCQAAGYRLPCVGEIDFLVNEFYRGDGGRAFDNLFGTDNCKLAGPKDAPNGRISFWTGTEADDAFGWTFFFDAGQQTFGVEAGFPKSARLPCLCVKRDPDVTNSGIPPCYNKLIDRLPAQ